MEPEDLASWSVYADLLQSKGDPRGELMSIMLQREQKPSPKLFEAQRRFFAKNKQLDADATWSRGFIRELRIETPDELAQLAEPELRFVDSVTLVIEEWADWTLADFSKRWRKLTIEVPAAIELPLVALIGPKLERLRIVLPDDDLATLIWDDVKAPALQKLVIVNAGTVDELDLPALKELWLLGESDGDTSLCERVVLQGDHVPAETYETNSNAFVLVGGRVELATLERLVARLTGLRTLSVRIAYLEGVTALQFIGAQDSDRTLPYRIAIGLENVLLAQPIVLVEFDEDRAQYLMLPQTRAHCEPDEVVRRAFDIAFGRDPGTSIHAEILDALAIADEHELASGDYGDQVLHVIDPQAAPLGDEPPEDEESTDDEDEEEEDYDDNYEEEQAAYEGPVLVAKMIQVEVVEIEAQEEDELPDEEITYATDEVLSSPEAWFEFRENWEDRATAPDDEPGEVRWPDPEDEAPFAVERQLATPQCSIHRVELDICSWCGATACWSCAETPIEGVCPTCFKETEPPAPPETANLII